MEPPVADFWSLKWDTPAGGTVQMATFKGKPLLINFWATWCPPCVEELPLINAFYNANKASGWKVLALAVDKPASVDKFLRTMPLDVDIGLAAVSGSGLSRSLGNMTGALPFTVILGPDGQIAHRHLGKVSPMDLTAWAQLK